MHQKFEQYVLMLFEKVPIIEKFFRALTERSPLEQVLVGMAIALLGVFLLLLMYYPIHAITDGKDTRRFSKKTKDFQEQIGAKRIIAASSYQQYKTLADKLKAVSWVVVTISIFLSAFLCMAFVMLRQLHWFKERRLIPLLALLGILEAIIFLVLLFFVLFLIIQIWKKVKTVCDEKICPQIRVRAIHGGKGASDE